MKNYKLADPHHVPWKRKGLRAGFLRIFLSIAFTCSIPLASNLARAQSTFGSIVGAVHDPSGGVVGKARITILDRQTASTRSATTDTTGSYVVVNLEPGDYQVDIEAPGFQRATYADLVLQARQTIRVDINLTLQTQSQSVSVADTAPVINTDVSNLAETKTGRELVDLPVAIGSRGSGSTSPITTLTTQPGIQTDNSGNISVSGSKQDMLSVNIDGISTMSPRSYAPISELFPSFNSIEEIRVSEINNAAEFGGISDITTISKGGTIENLRVMSGPPLLRQSALDAVSNWLYRPYLLNGQPVEVETTVNVVFTLAR